MTLPSQETCSPTASASAAIARGFFETPMLLGHAKDVQDALAKQVPFPPRLGSLRTTAQLVSTGYLENEMLNGEVIPAGRRHPHGTEVNVR